ncbi:hypothetical protein GF412_01695 [Candidatus Micrarchaeota archaeon]|nr:hypothetical protein [Candidatus Micrarchaeota archaeon]MBD3417676.1 hypothetical protein [Candidatus Micrarchaeota archaeon]
MIVENKRNGKKVTCEKACTPLSQIRGLMFRREVIPILFDFFRDDIHPIHSFFVPSAFYAIYISSSGEVVDKFRVVPSELHRQNSGPARYLLEIDEKRAAWFKKGDRVVLDARMENT